jgi:hypothetical protein
LSSAGAARLLGFRRPFMRRAAAALLLPTSPERHGRGQLRLRAPLGGTLADGAGSDVARVPAMFVLRVGGRVAAKRVTVGMIMRSSWVRGFGFALSTGLLPMSFGLVDLVDVQRPPVVPYELTTYSPGDSGKSAPKAAIASAPCDPRKAGSARSLPLTKPESCRGLAGVATTRLLLIR